MHSDDNGIKNSFVLKVKYDIICIESKFICNVSIDFCKRSKPDDQQK